MRFVEKFENDWQELLSYMDEPGTPLVWAGRDADGTLGVIVSLPRGFDLKSLKSEDSADGRIRIEILTRPPGEER